jgi:hypothetical protein
VGEQAGGVDDTGPGVLVCPEDERLVLAVEVGVLVAVVDSHVVELFVAAERDLGDLGGWVVEDWFPGSEEGELAGVGAEGLVVDLGWLLAVFLVLWTEVCRTFSLKVSQPLYAPWSGYLDPWREAKAAVSTEQPSGASGDMSKTFGPLNQGLLPPRW